MATGWELLLGPSRETPEFVLPSEAAVVAQSCLLPFGWENPVDQVAAEMVVPPPDQEMEGGDAQRVPPGDTGAVQPGCVVSWPADVRPSRRWCCSALITP